MLYKIWKNNSSYIFTPKDAPQNKHILDPDATCIGTISANSWEEAMTKYHEFMDWEPYVPMD